ncbi:MAG: rhodanese-like domain-containing protein [Maritimibacter sp.]|nr:rhodanese-like domain-containing protein [Maritimibacter sp.]
MTFSRRRLLSVLTALPITAVTLPATAQRRDVWTATAAYEALTQDRIRLLDIRTPEEWRETGVAQGAWPLNLYDDKFPERLFLARDLAEERPVALICRTGNRSGGVMQRLRASGYTNFLDISEGMAGSAAGPGWIKSGLPIVSAEDAIANLPAALSA